MNRTILCCVTLALLVSACQREDRVSVAPPPAASTNTASGPSPATTTSSTAVSEQPSAQSSATTETAGVGATSAAAGGMATSPSADVGATSAGAADATAAASSAADLMKAKGCLNCHDRDTKKVGPAFKDIAAKKPKKDALVAKLKEGKGHMKIAASDAELNTMVEAVLAMK
jgi:cytochrome c